MIVEVSPVSGLDGLVDDRSLPPLQPCEVGRNSHLVEAGSHGRAGLVPDDDAVLAHREGLGEGSGDDLGTLPT